MPPAGAVAAGEERMGSLLTGVEVAAAGEEQMENPLREEAAAAAGERMETM